MSSDTPTQVQTRTINSVHSCTSTTVQLSTLNQSRIVITNDPLTLCPLCPSSSHRMSEQNMQTGEVFLSPAPGGAPPEEPMTDAAGEQEITQQQQAATQQGGDIASSSAEPPILGIPIIPAPDQPADQPQAAAAPPPEPINLTPDPDTGRVATFPLPILTERNVFCEWDADMYKALQIQTEVIHDRTFDEKVDEKRAQLGLKFFQAAKRWENTPPTGTDYPGSVHNQLGWAMISDLQHPLITGFSISYSRLQYPVPTEAEFKDLDLDGKLDFVMGKLEAVAAKAGNMPVTLTAEQTGRRTHIKAVCVDSSTMAHFLAELALNSNQYGLHRFNEFRRDFNEKTQQRRITWSPTFPREKDSLTVNTITHTQYMIKTDCIQITASSNFHNLPILNHCHNTPITQLCRGRHCSPSPTPHWATASFCTPNQSQNGAPQSCTNRGLRRPWLSTSCSTQQNSSWTTTTRARMGCFGGSASRGHRHEERGTSTPRSCRHTRYRQAENLTGPVPRIHPTQDHIAENELQMQVVQLNHLRMEHPRFNRYYACMESTAAVRALPSCGPIGMCVLGRFSMGLIADSTGADCPNRYAVNFHIGSELDPSLMRAAGRKILERALDLKLAALHAQELPDTDTYISLLAGYKGEKTVEVHRSKLKEMGTKLDEVIFLQSGMSLERHILHKIPNPTMQLIIRGASKLDAFPLFLAGNISRHKYQSHTCRTHLHNPPNYNNTHTSICISTCAGADEEFKIYSGNVPVYSAMHHCSVVGYLDKRKVLEKGRWVKATLVALATGTQAETVAASMFTPGDVEQAASNLLRGDEWAQPPTVAAASRNPGSLVNLTTVQSSRNSSCKIKKINNHNLTPITQHPHSSGAQRGNPPSPRARAREEARPAPAQPASSHSPPPLKAQRQMDNRQGSPQPGRKAGQQPQLMPKGQHHRQRHQQQPQPGQQQGQQQQGPPRNEQQQLGARAKRQRPASITSVGSGAAGQQHQSDSGTGGRK